jgi:hypothetical protein
MVGSSRGFGTADQKGDIFSSLGSELFDEFVQRGPKFGEYGVDLRNVRRRDSLRTQCANAIVSTGVHEA